MKIHEKYVHLHFLVMSNSWAGWEFGYLDSQTTKKHAKSFLHHITSLTAPGIYQPDSSARGFLSASSSPCSGSILIIFPATAPTFRELSIQEPTSQTASARGYLSATIASLCSESSSTTRTWLAELISPTSPPSACGPKPPTSSVTDLHCLLSPSLCVDPNQTDTS